MLLRKRWLMVALACACAGLIAPSDAAGDDATASGVDASVWAGALSYRGATPRRDGRFAGMAADLRLRSGVTLEAAVEAVAIGMRFGPTIKQDDVTAGIGVPLGLSSRLRLGAHQSWDPVRERLQAQCAWADGTTYGSWWALGCGLGVSSETVATPAVRTAQASPHVGMSHGLGSWTLSQRFGAIGGVLDRDPGVGVERLPGTGARTALSADYLLAVDRGAWSANASGWCGRRCYAVIQDGYEIDDCPALYTGGFAFSASWRWRQTNVSLGAGREFFHAVFAHGLAHIDHAVLTVGASF